jgi:hypothetical protein
MIEEFDELALIDEAGELFQYPLSAAPRDWFDHITRERNCLIITGTDLRLATEGDGWRRSGKGTRFRIRRLGLDARRYDRPGSVAELAVSDSC